MLVDEFLHHAFDEVDPLDFYTSLFGASAHARRYGVDAWYPCVLSAEPQDDGTVAGTWRKWPIQTTLEMTSERADAYLPTLTYFHGVLDSHQAQELCAFVIDCDYVCRDDLLSIFDEWEKGENVLCPTYVVCSGGGLHFYYVLETPVDMRRRWLSELGFVNDLLENQYEGRIGVIDHRGIYQPYRIVGSRTKQGDTVAAFQTGGKWTIGELCIMLGIGEVSFTKEGYRPSEMSMKRAGEIGVLRKERREKAEAARSKNGKHHPERVRNFYTGLRDLYKSRAAFYTMQGHRFKQVMCLSVAAAKGGAYVSYDELQKDVRELWYAWNTTVTKHGGQPIMWDECLKAMRAYNNPKYREMGSAWIAEQQGVEWEKKTRRNGRTQEVHLKRARRWKAGMIEDDEPFKNPEGRPQGSGTKQRLVENYYEQHPSATVREAAVALGCSKTTVQKWRPRG